MPGVKTITVGGVTAEVYSDGHRKGSGFGTGPWRIIRYLVDYDDSDALIDGLLGSSNIAMIRGLPFPVPHAYPGNPILKCVNAEVVETIGGARPHDAPSPAQDTLVSFDKAVVECLYRTLDYPILPGDTAGGAGQFDPDVTPFARASIRYGMESHEIPPRALRLEDGSPYDGTQSMRVTLNTIDYVFRYEMFPGMPHQLWRQLMNRVNADPFWGHPRGTLLFIPGSCDPIKSPDGRFLTSSEFTLRYREVDHNAVIGEEEGGWIVLRKEDGTYTHPYANFGVLSGSI